MMIKYITVLALFAVGWTLTSLCTVERQAKKEPVNLAAIPTVIGEWRMVTEKTSLGAKEEKFLDEVLIRTYRRPDGKSVMLAIAYGADQRKNFSIHLPEVCYKASGCTVTSMGETVMTSPLQTLKQMLARKPEGALEAVQYWIMLNGKVVTSEFENRLRHFYISLFGATADGVLVRVSSLAVNGNYSNEYDIQKLFISALNVALKQDQRKLLFGT